MKVRTRYAPSPTGRMHVGNLRTALYAYLIAKHEGGDFLLRIEDTDQERYVEGAVDIIYRTLEETGLVHDEGPDKDGGCGPYVQSERQASGIYMEYAKQLGAPTISVTCCPGSELDRFADIGIAPAPGPEVVTGSTRMKSGTAQKMVLNMLSTGAMIKLGKVYGNLMVDVKPSNEKLIRRCVTIVCSAAECTEAEATKALEACDYRPKVAIVMVLRGVNADTACAMLQKAEGRIAKVLEA